MRMASKISPCLWFDTQAEEAAKLYTGISRNSSILATTRYGEAGKEIHRQRSGAVMTAPDIFASDDEAGAGRAMTALMKMKKLDLAQPARAFQTQ